LPGRKVRGGTLARREEKKLKEVNSELGGRSYKTVDLTDGRKRFIAWKTLWKRTFEYGPSECRLKIRSLEEGRAFFEQRRSERGVGGGGGGWGGGWGGGLGGGGAVLGSVLGVGCVVW